jgi:hypothetical protein
VRPEPFIEAFAWLIAVPLLLAAAMQLWSAHMEAVERVGAARDQRHVNAFARLRKGGGAPQTVGWRRRRWPCGRGVRDPWGQMT